MQTQIAHESERLQELKREESTKIEQRQRLQLQIEGLQQDGTLDELYQQESLQKSTTTSLI